MEVSWIQYTGGKGEPTIFTDVVHGWRPIDGVNWETYTGHVWRVSLMYESGPNPDFMEQQFPEDVAQSGTSTPFVLGRILFEDDGLGGA